MSLRYLARGVFVLGLHSIPFELSPVRNTVTFVGTGFVVYSAAGRRLRVGSVRMDFM